MWRPDAATPPDADGAGARGSVRSVNVGAIQTVSYRGRSVSTGIFKRPVDVRVGVHGVNVDGDDQADRRVHGGPERALYAYAGEDLDWWADELERPVPAGSMGENLTTTGLDVSAAVIGERWRVGSTVLEVAAPRIPCFKLGIAMADPRFPARFAGAGRPGAYLRIIEEGDIGPADPIDVVGRPSHDVTVALIATAYHHNRRLAARLLEAPALGDEWRTWALQHR